MGNRHWALGRNATCLVPRALVIALVALLLCIASGAVGQSATPPPTQPATAPPPPAPVPGPEDGPAYPVSEFVLMYLRDNPDHPPIDQLMQTEVELGKTPQGYVAPRGGVETVRMKMADAAGRGPERYYASALQRILEELRDELLRRHLVGVYVAPHPDDINNVGEDNRKPDQTTLRLLITTGIVTELRTLASGERVSDKGPIKPEDRINNAVHQRIRDRSPIQPYQAAEGQAGGVRRDLLRKDVLDRYLFFLSRHPGRRVDASVAASAEAGGVALDYQVTENRPLTLYAQFSNTGTRSTDYWRERFGLVHTQLTNHDDVLALDYITASFDKTHAVLGSYEAPFENDRIRWRIEGSWSQFTAQEVGFFGEDFTGTSWAAGGELIWNFYQNRELFLDLAGGARFENIRVENPGIAGFGETVGDEDFVVPHVALQLERTTDWFSTQASVGLEWWWSNANESELARLGRTAPDKNPLVFQWALSHAVYLEPLFNRKEWEDPSTPKSSTLAHEVQGSFRGQYAFGDRLIPQAEQVAGGLYTVRGYPESVVAGDTVLIGSVEYRLHVPRLFGIETEPRALFGRPFRFAPQYVYGRPDWDFILKAFFDAGRVYNSDRLSFERDETLLGTGIGFEVLFKRNLNIRVDWGFALEDTEAGPVHEGSNRLHFVATILF